MAMAQTREVWGAKVEISGVLVTDALTRAATWHMTDRTVTWYMTDRTVTGT